MREQFRRRQRPDDADDLLPLPGLALQKAFERNALIAGFEKTHPGITVDATWTANPRAMIVQQLAAGGGPDIMITDGSADVLYSPSRTRSCR